MNIAATLPELPSKLLWDSEKKEVSFPVCVSQHTVLCRIPSYVLKQTAYGVGLDPFTVVSRNFDIFLDAAICKVKRNLYERNGSVVLRLMDLHIAAALGQDASSVS